MSIPIKTQNRLDEIAAAMHTGMDGSEKRQGHQAAGNASLLYSKAPDDSPASPASEAFLRDTLT